MCRNKCIAYTQMRQCGTKIQIIRLLGLIGKLNGITGNERKKKAEISAICKLQVCNFRWLGSRQYHGSVRFQCMSGGTKQERQVAQAHLRLGDPHCRCRGGDGDILRVPQYIAHCSKRIRSLNLHIPRPTWILCVTRNLGPGTPLQACQNACQLTL